MAGSRIRALIALVLLTGLVLTACGDTVTNSGLVPAAGQDQVAMAEPQNFAVQAQTGGTIRIYSSLPLTGSSKEQSVTLVNAMTMALEDFGGADKTVAGFKIEYVSLDDATAKAGTWTEDQERANAQKVIADPDAMVYLGPFNSGAAKVSIPLLNKAGLVMISPSNSYPGLTKTVAGLTESDEPGRYYPVKPKNFFRVAITDDFQGPADVNFAITTLKASRFYVIDDIETYGKGLADAVTAEAKRRGVNVVGRESIKGSENNYRDLARRIRSSNADFIFFGGDAQNQPGKLLADIRASGVNAPFMGGDGLNEPAFVKEAGVAGEGAYSSISGVPSTQLPAKGQDFLKRYQARFGAPTNYTAYAYESMAVALTAIKNAGKKDRRAILDAVAATKNFDGVLGKWSFDTNGDTSQSDFSIYQITDGAYVFKQSVQPSK